MARFTFGAATDSLTQMRRPNSSVVAVSTPALSAACTGCVVKERKVAITGVTIRASCRRFRMSGLFAEAEKYTSAVPTRNLTENKPECCNYRSIGAGEQSIRGS